MKKKQAIFQLLFIIIIIMVSTSCQSYDNYYEEYGSEYGDSPFNDIIDYAIDEPLELIDDILSIIILMDTDTVRWKQREESINIAIEAMSDQNIIQHFSDIISDKDYANYIMWSVIEDISFMGLTSLPLGCIPVSTANSAIITNGVSTVKREYQILFTIDVNGELMSVPLGNKHFGMEHIYSKHSVEPYLKLNNVPSSNTSFFINGNRSNIKRLLKSFKITRKGYISKKGNRVLIGTCENKYMSRNYVLVVNEENVVTTFFPENTLNKRDIKVLTKQYRKDKFCKTYLKLKRKFKFLK